MTRKLFQQACRALFGPQYQAPAARALGIGRSTVVRYARGDRGIPPALFIQLARLVAGRQGEIGVLWPKLLAAAGSDGERVIRKLLGKKASPAG